MHHGAGWEERNRSLRCDLGKVPGRADSGCGVLLWSEFADRIVRGGFFGWEHKGANEKGYASKRVFEDTAQKRGGRRLDVGGNGRGQEEELRGHWWLRAKQRAKKQNGGTLLVAKKKESTPRKKGRQSCQEGPIRNQKATWELNERDLKQVEEKRKRDDKWKSATGVGGRLAVVCQCGQFGVRKRRSKREAHIQVEGAYVEGKGCETAKGK